MAVCMIPEMINMCQDEYPGMRQNQALFDRVVAMVIASQSLGYVVGPILSGILSDQYGFRGTTDRLMLTSLACGAFYFMFILIPMIWEKRR